MNDFAVVWSGALYRQGKAPGLASDLFGSTLRPSLEDEKKRSHPGPHCPQRRAKNYPRPKRFPDWMEQSIYNQMRNGSKWRDIQAKYQLPSSTLRDIVKRQKAKKEAA